MDCIFDEGVKCPVDPDAILNAPGIICTACQVHGANTTFRRMGDSLWQISKEGSEGLHQINQHLEGMEDCLWQISKELNQINHQLAHLRVTKEEREGMAEARSLSHEAIDNAINQRMPGVHPSSVPTDQDEKTARRILRSRV